LLLALLYALTNHARHNEITAMRAAGVSLARICVPYIAVGFLLSIALLVFNEKYAPKAADRADEVLKRRLERKLTPAEQHLIQPLKFINYGTGGKARAWYAPSYNTKTFVMTSPQVDWSPTNGPRLWLSADTAVWTNKTWVFSGHVIEQVQTNAARVLVTNEIAMLEFTERPREIQSEINVDNYRNFSGNKAHRADIPLVDIVNYLRLHPNPERKTRDWLYTKLHGRFAGPFACLVVVFVAVPFSAGSGRRNVFVGVATSIFIFIAYFILQQVGLTFGEMGWLPPWLGAWFPNLFFGIGGLLMMAKVR
jgi:lipopolysaccharide export system permease protein